MWSAIRRLAVRVLTDYDRRIIGRVETDPIRLLLLVKSKPNRVCPERQCLADEPVSTTPLRLHITARKLMILFGPELRNTASTGILCGRLYCLMMFVAVHWKADTQEIEGMNNMVQALRRQNPHISLVALDARLALRKLFGGGGKKGDRILKWSAVKDYVEEILDVAVECWEDSFDICRPERFETPAPSPIVNTTNGRPTATTEKTPALEWGIRYVRKIQRWTKEANFENVDEVPLLVTNVGGDVFFGGVLALLSKTRLHLSLRQSRAIVARRGRRRAWHYT